MWGEGDREVAIGPRHVLDAREVRYIDVYQCSRVRAIRDHSGAQTAASVVSANPVSSQS